MLPATTYLIVLGYLLDETVQKLSADILGLQDITEVESTRLSDLLKMIYPLEEIFILEPGQVSDHTHRGSNTDPISLPLSSRRFPIGSNSATSPSSWCVDRSSEIPN